MSADDIGRMREILETVRSLRGANPRNVWYVNKTAGFGHANYDGTGRRRAFSTIGAAVNAADDGDIIHIAADTYDEAVSIPAGKTGLQVICEPGVYLINTTPGTVVAIASACVYWEGGIIETNGQTGMEVNGQWFIGKNIQVYNSNIGFDLNSDHPLLINCRTNETASAGFDISEDSGLYVGCDVHGAAASRGFYLSHTNAHNNIFKQCSTLGCTAAGYECIAGADENLFDHCSQSSLCAGPTDNGANNTWAGHSQNSQITAGNTVQEDIASLSTNLGRTLCCMDFWSDPQEEVSVTSGAGTKTLPSVTVADLPSGATIVRAMAMFKFRMIENTNAAANKLDGATVASTSQVIQVRDDTPGTWRDAINFVDDQFGVAATTREGGDVCIGSIDIAVEVDGNDTYNFQWLLALADQDNLNFNDVQTGLRIWYSV